MGDVMLIEVMDRLLAVGSATTVSSLGDLASSEMAAEYEKASGNDKLMFLSGRFVEAEKANVNGAFWDTSDLEYGEHTIVNAPVNFLHRHRHVIGSFTESRLFRPGPTGVAEAAAAPQRPFLGVNAVLWREFFPYEARLVEMASNAKTLFWSMECQSKTIRCETSSDGSRQGCGKEYPFAQWASGAATVCAHVREKASQRHFYLPRFNAGAVIVPPVNPGWKGATAEVTAHAETLAAMHYAEAAAAGAMGDSQVVALMEQVIKFGESLAAVG
jgi:hypothetical protein